MNMHARWVESYVSPPDSQRNCGMTLKHAGVSVTIRPVRHARMHHVEEDITGHDKMAIPEQGVRL